MKKIFSLLWLFLLVIMLNITTNNVSAKESLKLPRLYFYGDVNKIKSKDEEIIIPVKYVDKKNSFEAYASIKWQGSSSLDYDKKNYTVKFYNDIAKEEKLLIDVGWGKQNKYCLKANWIDKTHSRNIVTARIASDVQKKYKLFKNTPNNGTIDGFPIEIYIQDEFLGLYTMNIPKDAWLFGMDEDNNKHTVIAGDKNNNMVHFNYKIVEFSDWELEVGHDDATTLKAFNRLISFVRDSSDDEFRNNIDQYFNLDSLLNYYVIMQMANLIDNQAKNMLLVSYDQKLWYASLYDLDTSWGTHWTGTSLYDYTVPIKSDSLLWEKLEKNFPNELANRYFELRKDVLSVQNILDKFDLFYSSIPKETLELEKQRWNNIPGYDLEQVNQFLNVRVPIIDDFMRSMYSINSGVSGSCIKDGDKIIARVVPLRSDVSILSNDSYTFDESGNALFVFSDYANKIDYMNVNININTIKFKRL